MLLEDVVVDADHLIGGVEGRVQPGDCVCHLAADRET